MPSALPYDRLVIDVSEPALRNAAEQVSALRPGIATETALDAVHVLLLLGWRPEARPEEEG